MIFGTDDHWSIYRYVIRFYTWVYLVYVRNTIFACWTPTIGYYPTSTFWNQPSENIFWLTWNVVRYLRWAGPYVPKHLEKRLPISKLANDHLRININSSLTYIRFITKVVFIAWLNLCYDSRSWIFNRVLNDTWHPDLHGEHQGS